MTPKHYSPSPDLAGGSAPADSQGDKGMTIGNVPNSMPKELRDKVEREAAKYATLDLENAPELLKELFAESPGMVGVREFGIKKHFLAGANYALSLQGTGGGIKWSSKLPDNLEAYQYLSINF